MNGMNIDSFIPRKCSIDAMGATIRDAVLLNMWAWVFSCGSRHGSLSDRLIQATGLPQLGQKFVISSSFCPQLGQ